MSPVHSRLRAVIAVGAALASALAWLWLIGVSAATHSQELVFFAAALVVISTAYTVHSCYLLSRERPRSRREHLVKLSAVLLALLINANVLFMALGIAVLSVTEASLAP